MFCLNQIWMCFNSLLSVLVFYKHWDLGLSKLDYFGFSSLNTATVYRNALRCWVVCLFKRLFLVFYIYVRVIPASLSQIKSESECLFVFAVPLRAERRRQGAGRFGTGGSGCSHLIPSQGQIWVFISAFLSMMLCFALVLSPFVKWHCLQYFIKTALC